MSSPDWQELERLWQDSPAATPAKEIIARQHRRRWLSRLLIVLEILFTIIGIVLAVHLMVRDRPDDLPLGLGLLLLVLLAAAVTIWARWPPRATDSSITSALDNAVHRTRVNVRLALASLWVVTASLFFMATIAFLALQGTQQLMERRLHTLGFYSIWLGTVQVLVILYYLRRSRELARLEEIRRSLLG